MMYFVIFIIVCMIIGGAGKHLVWLPLYIICMALLGPFIGFIVAVLLHGFLHTPGKW